MTFSFSDIAIPITKDLLLKHNSEETYMSTYLGIPVKKGLQISPLRQDKRPTASFYRNKNGDLIFHDFGTGFNGNFISVVMELNHCSFVEALNIIANDFDIIKTHTPKSVKKVVKSDVVFKESAETNIQIQDQPFTDFDIKWWNSFGVSLDTLQMYQVHSCKNVFLNGILFSSYSEYNPSYGYYGGARNDLELWRIYYPNKDSYRFLSNWSGTMIQGCRQLPLSGKTLVITKSLKDVMCLHELGISAIAPCSETLFVTDEQLKKLKQRFEKIIVFYDNDIPGIANMRKIKKLHPELTYFFIPRKYHAKDTTDFVKLYGIENTKDLIKNCLAYDLEEN